MDLDELCKELPEKLSDFIKTALNEKVSNPFYDEIKDTVKKYLGFAVNNQSEIETMSRYDNPQTLLTYIMNYKNNIVPCFRCYSLLPKSWNYCGFCGAEIRAKRK